MAEKPRFIKVESYVEARTKSVAQLLQAIDNEALVSGEVTKGPRTAAQRLPRHMRRRAMAHEVRRFPRGIRQFAAPYLASSKHRKKPPSRFARRKPTNILKNYERRKRKAKWLETHIWHAKRFKMVERYGFKIAEKSYQRGFRAALRDSLRHCTVRDRSHLACFLIKSPDQGRLIESLAVFCDSSTGPTFAFPSSLNGSIETSTLLFDSTQTPKRCIGPARFLWSFESASEEHLLSLWIHPSTRNVVFGLLKSIFELEAIDVESNTMEGLEREYRGKNGVKVSDLHLLLNRFSLFGPKALEIVAKSIILAESDLFNLNHEEWVSCISLSKPSGLRDGAVFTLLVEDPRLSTRKRKPLDFLSSVCTESPSSFKTMPQSLLWNAKSRQAALEKRLSQSDLERLNTNLVNGVVKTDSKVPIMVIVKNGSPTLTGAEVIVPEGFGKDFWISLQWSGAHASGEKDDVAAHFESALPHFPDDAVDAEASALFEEQMQRDLEIRHSKRPFNRRVKFWEDLSIVYPFSFQWEKLLREWNDENSSEVSVSVMRNPSVLKAISEWLHGKSALPELDRTDFLVPVRLKFPCGGRPKRFAIICHPEKVDLNQMREKAKFFLEEKRPEKETVLNAKVTLEKESGLTSRKFEGFVSLDPSASEKPIRLSSIFVENSSEPASKRRKMNRLKRVAARSRGAEQLQRLEHENDVNEARSRVNYVESASRKIIGRVMSGEQSMTQGKGIAFGYIAFNALRQLPRNSPGRPTALVRNTTSRYFHPAHISVVRRKLQI
ncbi:unnamed protein product [Caenorhabditis auriculariae]|uniref:Uncharacterized protein n=1 Tax=Caenorhabditis auriculariae TaxID=2777116 RepID=A0A8S1GWL3_9PELO|nr:unnamed protein product [Caenorhabditis auriculariae]